MRVPTPRAGLAVAGVLALQRTIGNAATTRVLHGGAGSATVIQRQRKIGFELEDVKWRTWKETPVEGVEAETAPKRATGAPPTTSAGSAR